MDSNLLKNSLHWTEKKKLRLRTSLHPEQKRIMCITCIVPVNQRFSQYNGRHWQSTLDWHSTAISADISSLISVNTSADTCVDQYSKLLLYQHSTNMSPTYHRYSTPLILCQYSIPTDIPLIYSTCHRYIHVPPQYSNDIPKQFCFVLQIEEHFLMGALIQ